MSISIPPQEPAIGLLLAITPIAKSVNETDKTMIPSIISIIILDYTIFET